MVDLERAETLLVNVFDDVHQRAALSDQSMLDHTQARWKSDRDVFCEAIGERAGTIQALNVLDCKAQMTHERTIDLCRWDNPNGIAEESPMTCRTVTH